MKTQKNICILTETELKLLLSWSHDYGKSYQFNIGMFGSNCLQSKGFTEENAINYCLKYVKCEPTNNS